MIVLEYPEGATPIDSDELHALIPNITLQSELNQFERENIRQAIRWAETSRALKKQLFALSSIRRLHKAMFGEVWKWAGTFRATEKNIGVPPHTIGEELLKFCQDMQFQIDQGIQDWQTFAVNVHHRLVWIHPFPNGNGRFARLFADRLLLNNMQETLSWGYSSDLGDQNEIRSEYIAALKEADKGDISRLVYFATNAVAKR